MATTYTTNYNLGKQENHADKFDMDVITDNADKIDEALTAKADKSTTYTKTEVDTALSGKQAALTTEQLAAVNSGVTSTDVSQIQTNKNNILSITPALQECVDNGAKNLLNITGVDMSWATINADKSITVNYTTSGSNKFVHIGFNNLSTTAFVPTPNNFIGALLSGNDSTVSGIILIMEFSNDGTSWAADVSISTQTDKARVLPNYPYCRLVIKFNPSIPSGTYTFKPMICEKSLYDVSPTYQPYAFSNVELTAKEQVNENNISTKLSMAQAFGYDVGYALTGSVNLNDIKTVGVYYYTAAAGTTITNAPTTSTFRMEVIQTAGAARYCQFMFANADNAIYFRNLVGSTWTGWYKIGATAV